MCGKDVVFKVNDLPIRCCFFVEKQKEDYVILCSSLFIKEIIQIVLLIFFSFQVLSKDGQIEVGQIRKKWTGFGAESFTDADLFGVSFPMDLDVRMKAVMLGAVFLIVIIGFNPQEFKIKDL